MLKSLLQKQDHQTVLVSVHFVLESQALTKTIFIDKLRLNKLAYKILEQSKLQIVRYEFLESQILHNVISATVNRAIKMDQPDSPKLAHHGLRAKDNNMGYLTLVASQKIPNSAQPTQVSGLNRLAHQKSFLKKSKALKLILKKYKQ